MELSPSDVRFIAEFVRKATKAANVEVVIAQAFQVLRSIANTEDMRIIYSPAPSTWKEWSASAGSMEVRTHDDWPAPLKKAVTVFFDPENQSAGYVSGMARDKQKRPVLQLLAPQLWSALLLQSALARVQHTAVSETELVRETLRARDEERRHIARELHDDFGQQLASLQLALKWAEDRIRSRDGTQKIVRTLSDARENMSLMLSKVRDLSHALYPRILDTLGLVAALKELIYQASGHSGMAIEFTSRGRPRQLDKEASVALYRCCQEAISNVIRHSQASTLRIQVHFGKEETRVAVEDDGRGFDPRTLYDSSARIMSSGFWTIRQRMADLGGAFRVSTAEGRGTVVELMVPYVAREVDA